MYKLVGSWPSSGEEDPDPSLKGFKLHRNSKQKFPARRLQSQVHCSENEGLLSDTLMEEREMQIIAPNWLYLYPGRVPSCNWHHNFALWSTCQQELWPLLLLRQINVSLLENSVRYWELLIQEACVTKGHVCYIWLTEGCTCSLWHRVNWEVPSLKNTQSCTVGWIISLNHSLYVMFVFN